MKKIKKYFPLIIGLVLLLSVAAYGTRAYFTDSTTQKAGIELKLGNVDIESHSTEWTIDQKGTKNKVGQEVKNGNTYVTNAKPGDSFSRTFTFKNNSSLKTKFKMTQNITAVDEKTKTAFDVNLKLLKGKYNNMEYSDINLTNKTYSSNLNTIGGNEIVLNGKEEGKILLTIAVKEDSENTFNKITGSPDAFVLNLLDEMIKVELIDADGSITE